MESAGLKKSPEQLNGIKRSAPAATCCATSGDLGYRALEPSILKTHEGDSLSQN
jgi:hypothetical protein